MTGIGYAHAMAAQRGVVRQPTSTQEAIHGPSAENGFKVMPPWTPPDDGLQPPWYRPGHPGASNICEPCYILGGVIRSLYEGHDEWCEAAMKEVDQIEPEQV